MKPRVSWPPGPKLCQVKMFRIEECAAKVASQPQGDNYRKQSSWKTRGPDLPPGFEGNQYADKPNVSNIPRIKWKRPPKFHVNHTWLVGNGGESTQRKTENLRIAKELEAIYPHRSAIPSRPSVSPLVEAECFDDSTTPAIRLTPIEDEWEDSSSHTTTNKLEMKPTQELVSGLAPDLSLAAITALLKTNEQGSMVDPHLLIKILSDPKIIKNLITDTTGIPSETKNDLNNPTRLLPQHVTTSPVARKPHPIIIPQEQSFAASHSFTNPELRHRNISPLKKVNGNPLSIPMPVQSCVRLVKRPSLPSQLPSSFLPMNYNLQRLQPQPNSAFLRSCEMNNVQASIGYGRGPQTRFHSYTMNLNKVDARPKPVMQPMKNVDYFKNLIKEHGTDNLETNQYHSETGIYKRRFDNTTKIQKQCIYFVSPRGCTLGESCTYVHDRLRPNFEAEGMRAKRFKYDKNGL